MDDNNIRELLNE